MLAYACMYVKPAGIWTEKRRRCLTVRRGEDKLFLCCPTNQHFPRSTNRGHALRRRPGGNVKTQDVVLGSQSATGYEIDLPGAPLILVQAAKGFVMCGYLDIKSVDKFGQAAAVVRGVKSIDDLLAKTVSDVSLEGERRGIKSGMTGREALLKLF